jgi:hypothetical protein
MPARSSLVKPPRRVGHLLESLEQRQLLSVSLNAAGWIVVTPSSNSRIVYVSTSVGNDKNTGLAPSAPVQTLGKAVSLLRDGHGDEMLLRRGDVWHDSLGVWWKSGQSQQNPLVIGAYGLGARPLLDTGTADAFDCGETSHPSVNNIVINGIAFQADAHDPSSPNFNAKASPDGIHLVSKTANFTIQDCTLKYYVNNITMVNYFGPISHVTIARCNISYSFSSTGAHSEGAFLEGVQGIQLMGNVFDHDGWDTAGGGYATIFNHDVYVTATSNGLIARNNIFAEASSHGLQARCGGSIENNVFLDDPTGLSFGLVNGSPVTPGGVTGDVVGNLFIGGRNISPALPRGTGLEIGNTYTATVADNLFANNPTSMFPAIELGYGTDDSNPNDAAGLNDVSFKNNVIYNWGHGIGSAAGLVPASSGPRSLNNVSFINNVIQQITSGDIVLQGGVLNTNAERWSGNIYNTPSTTKTPFSINHLSYSSSYWLTNIDPTGKLAKMNFPNAGATISSFNGSIGLPSTETAILAAAARQSQQNWNAAFTTSAILSYFHNAFGGGLDGKLV